MNVKNRSVYNNMHKVNAAAFFFTNIHHYQTGSFSIMHPFFTITIVSKLIYDETCCMIW